jgi:hypothetical protein
MQNTEVRISENFALSGYRPTDNCAAKLEPFLRAPKRFGFAMMQEFYFTTTKQENVIRFLKFDLL